MDIARGILRIEQQNRKTAYISKKLGNPENFRFRHISEDIAAQQLQTELDSFGLHQPIPGKAMALNVLSSIFPRRKAMDLYNRLMFMSNHPTMAKKQIAEAFGVSTAAVNGWLREIKTAGISPSLVDSVEYLPPLIIEKNWQQQFFHESLVSQKEVNVGQS